MKGNSEGVGLTAHIHEVPNPPCSHHSLLPCRRETPIEVGRQGSALSQKRVPTHGTFFQDLCRSPVLSQSWPWQFRAAEALDFSGSHRGSVGIRAGCAAPQKIWFGTWGLSCGSERSPHGCVGWRNEYLASKIPLESRPRTVASPTRAWAARRTGEGSAVCQHPHQQAPQEAAGGSWRCSVLLSQLAAGLLLADAASWQRLPSSPWPVPALFLASSQAVGPLQEPLSNPIVVGLQAIRSILPWDCFALGKTLHCKVSWMWGLRNTRSPLCSLSSAMVCVTGPPGSWAPRGGDSARAACGELEDKRRAFACRAVLAPPLALFAFSAK